MDYQNNRFKRTGKNLNQNKNNTKRKFDRESDIKKKSEKEPKFAPSDISELKEYMGKVSLYRIVRITPIGAYITPASTEEGNPLSDTDNRCEILLPKNEFAEKTPDKGSLINAFLYHDSEDRPIATLKTPLLTIGKLAVLKCKQASSIGAFLDWGLMKDLFLPFKEQTAKVKADEDVLVTLYTDKSSRLCASMKVYKLLRTDSEYEPGDNVEALIYELSTEHGAYAAVDNIFSAMIPRRELMRDVRVGERLKLRVARVLPDGKLELSMREPGYLQIKEDCDKIYEELQKSPNGFLPYHDKTASLVLKTKFNMSKNSFKRAIGHLYKEGLITIQENGIALSPSKSVN
ncbi:MAG: RNA-binding protein [Lachnospiraceae bacterium]|nr:RNA-binding protein [Lachnospiraceae bacterium]